MIPSVKIATVGAILFTGCLLFAEHVRADEGWHDTKATVLKTHKQVSAQTPGGESKKLKENTALIPGTVITTGPKAYVDLSVNGISSVIQVEPDTVLELRRMRAFGSDKQTELYLRQGEIIGNVKKISGDSSYDVMTPAATAKIRGTDFQIRVNPTTSGASSTTFDSVTGEVTCKAMVYGKEVIYNLTSGMDWTPGTDEPHPLSVAEKTKKDFYHIIFRHSPDQNYYPLQPNWRIPSAPPRD